MDIYTEVNIDFVIVITNIAERHHVKWLHRCRPITASIAIVYKAMDKLSITNIVMFDLALEIL